MEKINETIQWLDSAQTAPKEEVDSVRKDLENVCMPVMSKLHGGGQAPGGMPNMEDMANAMGGGGMPNMEDMANAMGGGGMPNMEDGGSGPTVEDVD